MAPKLTVQNAEIKTAAVELKTLTVSGKQVTLAVFRQLREEQLIAEDGTLNGVPWGTVNYHPDKCADSPKHWHVVWQRGSELLRAAELPESDSAAFRTETADRYLLACVWDHLNGGSRHFNNQPLPSDGDGRIYRGRSIKICGLVVPMWVPNDAANAAYMLKGDPDYRPFATEEWAPPAGSPTADELYASLKVECAEETERRARDGESRQVIADLPQLFIAV